MHNNTISIQSIYENKYTTNSTDNHEIHNTNTNTNINTKTNNNKEQKTHNINIKQHNRY